MPRTAWNKKLTPEIEDLIVTQYQAGRTANEILATIPFRTRKTVYDVLERHGVARREGLGAYKRYNQAAFANVASEPAAYWLGLLITDGYILDTHGGGEIQIGLQLTDRELIEGFAEFVGKSGPIQTIEPRSPDHKTMY